MSTPHDPRASTNRETGTNDTFWAVIPAGGSGTRLWPLSRTARPKFLLALTSNRSLLQQTVDRLVPLAPPDRTLTICGPAHAAEIARHLPKLPAANIVIEPAPKGSGPAIGLGAALIARHDPNAIMGSFAADHDVRDPLAFVRAVKVAIEAARAGWLVTVGITPTRPETGYGYIERTDEVVITTNGGDAYRAARFVEKPDLERATAYVASGQYFWNASMFIWRVGTLLEEMARMQPELHAGLLRIADAWGTPHQEQVMTATWATLEESTIDQGVMERASRVAVVPADIGWSDVGEWHGLGELMERDGDGNSIRGDLVSLESRGCVVWSITERAIALVGLDDVVVVDTPDGLLVANRARAQDVKQIVKMLKDASRGELT